MTENRDLPGPEVDLPHRLSQKEGTADVILSVKK